MLLINLQIDIINKLFLHFLKLPFRGSPTGRILLVFHCLLKLHFFLQYFYFQLEQHHPNKLQRPKNIEPANNNQTNGKSIHTAAQARVQIKNRKIPFLPDYSFKKCKCTHPAVSNRHEDLENPLDSMVLQSVVLVAYIIHKAYQGDEEVGRGENHYNEEKEDILSEKQWGDREGEEVEAEQKEKKIVEFEEREEVHFEAEAGRDLSQFGVVFDAIEIFEGDWKAGHLAKRRIIKRKKRF